MKPAIRSLAAPAVALAVALSLTSVVPLTGCGLWSESDEKQEPATKLPPPPESLDSFLDLDQRPFPLLTWATYVVTRDYVSKQRFDPSEQLKSALTELGRHRPAFFATYEPSAASGEFTVTVGSATQTFKAGDLGELMAASDVLSEVLVFTRDALELEGTPLRELEYHAINGLLAPLDPHTILLDPREHNDLGVRTRGQFGGIGAEIRVDQRRIGIVRVMPGSPAEKAGVKDGDILLEIGEQSTVSMSSLEAQELLRGPVGTEVEVKIQRGEEILTTTITRAIIRVESVNYERLADDVGYVQLTTFQKNTGEKVRDAISDMSLEAAAGEARKGGPLKGLVIDVRGNSGGLLTQAIEVLDLLVGTGELVIVRSSAGRESQSAKPEVVLPATASVVVLVDEDSASASEIVSGAITALKRGVVVGRSTFGKGSVQLLTPKTMYEQEQALKLTIAEYQV
ncbi:MAG: S41 family peptidase, partial [Nannocystaceae bacterium]